MWHLPAGESILGLCGCQESILPAEQHRHPVQRILSEYLKEWQVLKRQQVLLVKCS